MIQESSSENFHQSQAEIERLKQRLKESEQAYHLIAQMSQLKAGLLARIAHELRSPLTTIMSLNQLILSDLCETPEEERKFITKGQEALSKLQTILDQVIAIAHTENCGINSQMQSCSLDEILADVYAQTHLQAHNCSLKLELIIPNHNLKVYADYQRLLHALILLIDTSISLSKTQKIVIEVEEETNLGMVGINLDFTSAKAVFSEPIDLMNNLEIDYLNNWQDLSVKINLSMGSKLHLISHLLESMGGKLIVVQTSPFTRLQCLLEKALIQD
ncbi:sensor histidine kinase KdpD [Gloeocapsa sp. PCC 73106]|uniref:sensor histidine kinase n=1 Tax=Gloeocapsa sp. PCC 73106 TaxID=102232 RepID=UPI0002AC65ED|nr:histidine kinase dimerization/phospho-acceptor domain-containing protein [Gloeocapsa sp. PCC 73106]ELR99498.1 histidine kinase [Gloeocapsa sp. PCC 73106]